jgi:phenylacetate-CoA oxygenase PaaI subunit
MTGAPTAGIAAETAALATMVGSLADNKAALGRRYGEWAVSAPTLESAVAAAAMAQDELGHARSTYPLLKQLDPEGHHEDDDYLVGGAPLALLEHELPDWTSFVAANLLVDGMLTTFVAACAHSSIEHLAQRSRKILQEEGSHRVHAEAWARRLCRAGEREREELVHRLQETWRQVALWPGPNGDTGYLAAMDMAMAAQTPAQLRERMRAWLVDLLSAEGVAIDLHEPRDWSGWDPRLRR